MTFFKHTPHTYVTLSGLPFEHAFLMSIFKLLIFTARVRSTREGNVYTWECLSVHGGGGRYPIQPNELNLRTGGKGIHPTLEGGTPSLNEGIPQGILIRPDGGTPHLEMEVLPCQAGWWYPLPNLRLDSTWTGYAAAGTPLSVSRRTFLLCYDF